MDTPPVSRRMATKKEERFYFDEHNTKFLANFDVVAVRYNGQRCIFLKFKYSEEPFEMQDKDLKAISFIMPAEGAGKMAQFLLEAEMGN